MAVKRASCPSCGVDVDAYVMLRQGVEITHCSICGLVIPDESKSEQSLELLKCVALAEDAAALRTMLEKMLVEQKVTRTVVSATNGAEFVTLASKRLKEGLPISVAILDVEMPTMTGIQAAVTLRKLETSLGVKRKTPLLFFTSKPCDERFKAMLKQLEPSSYVNKGQDPEPLQLVKRVHKVLNILFNKNAEAV